MGSRDCQITVKSEDTDCLPQFLSKWQASPVGSSAPTHTLLGSSGWGRSRDHPLQRCSDRFGFNFSKSGIFHGSGMHEGMTTLPPRQGTHKRHSTVGNARDP